MSDMYYKELFTNIKSTANICNMSGDESDDESDEEKSLSMDCTDYS